MGCNNGSRVRVGLKFNIRNSNPTQQLINDQWGQGLFFFPFLLCRLFGLVFYRLVSIPCLVCTVLVFFRSGGYWWWVNNLFKIRVWLLGWSFQLRWGLFVPQGCADSFGSVIGLQLGVLVFGCDLWCFTVVSQVRRLTGEHEVSAKLAPMWS